MDFWQETNWFAMQTKPFQEKLAAACVAKLDVAVFLPKVQVEQEVCGFVRRLTKPLFPGYFFARFCPLLSFDVVRYARGVLRILGNSRYPIPLAPEIITGIRDRLQPDGFVRLDLTRFTPGDRVTIEQGPLAGWMGTVEREWDDGKRVMLLLEAVQQARVLIEKRWLVAAETA